MIGRETFIGWFVLSTTGITSQSSKLTFRAIIYYFFIISSVATARITKLYFRIRFRTNLKILKYINSSVKECRIRHQRDLFYFRFVSCFFLYQNQPLNLYNRCISQPHKFNSISKCYTQTMNWWMPMRI